MFPFGFQISGFILILTGIGDLVEKARQAFLLSLALPIAVSVLAVTTQPETLGRAISLSPYLLISVALLVIRQRYSASIDMLIVGWLLLLLVNVGQPMNLIDPAFVEAMAIFSKIVILYGMMSQRFSFLVDDLRRYLVSGVPIVYNEENHLGITLVNTESGVREDDLKWIVKRANENAPKAVRTIVITTYDTISTRDLGVGSRSDQEFYMVRIVQGGRRHGKMFDKQVMTINDDPNELEQLFSDIINFSMERKIRCEIVFYSLSAMIHTHGWKRMYSFLLSKLPLIKSSNISLYAFYYPKTHSEGSDIAKFEMLSDRVIHI